jgi:hypothetical protein
MPWTSQPITVDADVMEILQQLPEEAIVEYLQSLGYEVNK